MKRFINFTLTAVALILLLALPAFAIPPETTDSGIVSETSSPESSELTETTVAPETTKAPESAPLPRPHPEILSPGMLNIAARCKLRASAMAGNVIKLSEDDFLRALNKRYVTTVKITGIPSPMEGTLKLGDYALKPGDTVAGNDLSALSFVPAGVHVTSAEFSFTEGENEYEITGALYFLSEKNSVPIVRDIAVGTSVATYKELSYFGHLPGFDPDGHMLEYIVVDYPKNGAISLDSKSGEYEYIPDSGFTGKDSFKYVISDRYGAYSASETVYITVDSLHEDELFDDMSASASYAEAITLARSGILGGRTVGGKRMFLPEGSLTRGEFIQALMTASGADVKGNTLHTVFADDADIPYAMKGAVASAYELGYIKGTEKDGKLYFLPNEQMSLAECASVIGRVLEIEDEESVPVFSFVENCPEDAAPAVNLLCAVSILPTDRESLDANDVLTREYAAKVLMNVKTFVKLYR